MNRTVFLIDGFNLYHSLRDASKVLGNQPTKWLDVDALCTSYLHVIGSGASLNGVHYFSALATHLETGNPDITRRHRDFMRCLRDRGVHVELARFKKKSIPCNHCGKTIVRREEKETDVAIAIKLFEVLYTDAADSVIIMSGDTDLAPALRTAKVLFPEKVVGCAFPFGRKNKELTKLADFAFTISKEQYVNHQFPNPYVLKSGVEVPKPSGW